MTTAGGWISFGVHISPRFLALAALGFALSGCDSKPAAKPANAGGNSPLTAPIDYIAAQGKAKQHTTKVISTVEIEAAIRQFQAIEDRLPTGFDELVSQHYLQSVPAAPRGKRFTYNPQTGQIGLVNE